METETKLNEYKYGNLTEWTLHVGGVCLRSPLENLFSLGFIEELPLPRGVRGSHLTAVRRILEKHGVFSRIEAKMITIKNNSQIFEKKGLNK